MFDKIKQCYIVWLYSITEINSDLIPVIAKSRKALGCKRSDPKGACILKPFLWSNLWNQQILMT
jgi:hypothetical protein